RSSDRTLRAVGSYGRGVTQLLAIPLWDDAAEPLREQLDRSPGREVLGPGLSLRIGPLSVILTDDADSGAGWLVAGTVTQRTLVQAAREVVSYSRGQP
ncbi:MAG: hypothetical protein H0T17_07495, partial [Propionibacteriales bacterium]|nr:hypothetical protein [Propionibacteriales bacterium]